jgi:DNA topoisomerase-1
MLHGPTSRPTLRKLGLRYITDETAGIVRRKVRRGFHYLNPDGTRVQSPAELERIRLLAIPPAYHDVWICPDPKGYIQAVGFDDAGRKQYRYHSKFRAARDDNKFHQLSLFGKSLPELRRRVQADLDLQGLPKRKVLAVVVYLLEKSLIRVGNGAYAKKNNTYGLTTMLTEHVCVSGQSIQFRFLGKSKIWHDIEIHDRKLAALIKKIQDLPGQALFHFMDESGEIHGITSADVNSYLKEIAGADFTAKDFRTWWGTLLALEQFSQLEIPKSDAEAKRAISSAMKVVSSHLGNTPTVCRKCYVHPSLFEAFKVGKLPCEPDRKEAKALEDQLLAFLSDA